MTKPLCITQDPDIPGQVEARYSAVDVVPNEASTVPRVKSSEPFGSAFSALILRVLMFFDWGCVSIHSAPISPGQPIMPIIVSLGGKAEYRGTYSPLLYDSERKIAISVQYWPSRKYKVSTSVQRCRGVFPLLTSLTSI